ncbi:hypothetical protein Hanom_Chr14g01302441 [Helianthus anomalus]
MVPSWRVCVETDLGVDGGNGNMPSKLQKSYFMFISDYKVRLLSLIITKNILHVCKPLHGLSFALNIVYFYS